MALTPKAVRRNEADPALVQVEVGGRTHEVSIERADHERLAPGYASEALAEAAFRFLLDREPSSAIMARFDLMTIARYFPDFEEKLSDYL